VTLVAANVGLADPAGAKVITVTSARQMREAVLSAAADADAVVMAAAVADFRPARRKDHKIRREETPHLSLDLEPVPDLLAALAGEHAAEGVFMVAFAAESADLDARAADKARRKGVQAIVANDISRSDIGFGSDYNAGVMLFSDGSRHELDRMTKREMADRILDLVLPRLRR
jgi:phosphopantothenoylcysteine decarboxylase/phosphopantothenate--cysteine ligase